MMVEFCVQRQGYMLLPLSSSDRDTMMLLPERRIVTVTAEPKAPERLKRWFFAMLQLLVEATDRWPNTEMARREIMTRTGFFESIVIGADGTTRFTAQSMSGWGIVEWRCFLDRAVPYVIENYVGESRPNFRARVDAFLGIKYREAWEG